MVRFCFIWVLLVCCSPSVVAQQTVSMLANINRTMKAKDMKVAVSYSPFQIANGLVVVHAKLNGRNGAFILDTGAPGMVINQKVLKNEHDASGVGGQVQVGSVQIASFEWGGIVVNNFEGYAIQMEHLEKATGLRLQGLIGYEVLKEVELYMDFAKNIIEMYPATKNHLHEAKIPSDTWTFDYQHHLPIVQAKIGRKRIRLGLDTGAESNLLDQEIIKSLPKGTWKKIKDMELQGLDQQVVRTKLISIEGVSIENTPQTESTFLVANLSPLQSDNMDAINGILGAPFFKDKKVSINFKSRKIYFWE